MALDHDRPFIPLNIAILTVSDTRSLSEDKSGQILVDRLEKDGHILADRKILKDDIPNIVTQLNEWCDNPEIDVVISTGGTGLTGRDGTPEAFEQVYEKPIPGFGELFRMLSYQKIGSSTIQSRATAGVAKGTYLFAVPGSSGACKDAWDDILQTQLDNRHRPCNFVEIAPRLREHEK
ncbi:molybdenum cofactor biosynthesis protein B [Curvivirga aplysinae]|uniref:molybdenum cofactor biosynthesis protein B n=1 Tax=Curvivirga aplysinae TaxID=2529852 RepID=UPI0012BBFB86|nr:molybdenum cofactor biosynthesis protein B [Curvivirga aplysinae]MTI08412.1 molybdenum cofactor biosynthesis protein B [Curvivirga aplysinae]